MKQKQQNYVVEDVIKKKVVNGETYYRIKWQGYPSWQNTWEPAYHLPKDVIEFYEEREREIYDEKIKRHNAKKLKNCYPENQVPSFVIDEHYIDDQNELMFRVTARNKKIQMSRDELLRKQGKKLAEYYIKLAKQKKIY